MPLSLLLLIFNIFFLLILIDGTVLIPNSPIVQLSVYPSHGLLLKNIELRCQITEPSKLDNIYLSVHTDDVKPSGIILMFDSRRHQCLTNKKQYINVDTCNSSLILVRINHTILNDTLQRIDYVCSQGEVNAMSSYRILKDQLARYSDASKNTKLNNSSSTLIHTLFLLLFGLLSTRVTTIEELR